MSVITPLRGKTVMETHRLARLDGFARVWQVRAVDERRVVVADLGHLLVRLEKLDGLLRFCLGTWESCQLSQQ